MKLNNIFIASALLLAMPLAMSAQGTTLSDAERSDHGIVRHIHHPASRPGEVLVKFKAELGIKMLKPSANQCITTGVSKVDALCREFGVKEIDKLMPFTGSRVSAKKLRTYNGKSIEDKNLDMLYCVKATKPGISVSELVDKFSALEEVEYAEPNYLVYAMDATETDDPLADQQTYLDLVNIKPLWGAKPLNAGKRPVIAIIDTGVDISHPDLADNIWTNPLEAEGEEGTDDDANGFKDDIHGWDFVNQTGRLGDWNGHGTHCAGIAAATGNNKIGIIGANPDALIMPVTVMQSDGVGDVATIIKGIDYASANGADVISMSIGTYQYSIALEQSLGKAYANAVLVAAAGNDCASIGPLPCPFCGMAAPCFPAAFTFVLGVQAADAFGMFSNNDIMDGPIYSAYDEEKLYNYELKAPGVKILSTYPGGRYKALSGTSMACPLVAGSVSRLLQTKEYLSKELLFGDLIHASGENYVDFKASYDIADADRKPTLALLSCRIDDSEGDGDGRPDAGETIKIYPMLRNDWGQADNVKLAIAMGENDDASLVEFVTPEVDFGHSLSSYAKSESLNPIIVKLSKDIVDGRHLRLAVTATCDNCSPDYEPLEFMLNVENGVELKGTQRENITLYPGVSYIVSQNWGIPRDVTVTVKPGAKIKIKDDVGVSNYGHMIFEGTPDSMIVITKGDNDLGNIRGFLNDNANYVTFNYVIFENLSGYMKFDGHEYNNCIIRNNYVADYLTANATFRNCDIYNNRVDFVGFEAVISEGSSFTECNIHNNLISNPYVKAPTGWGHSTRFYKSNYIDNEIVSYPDYLYISSLGPKDMDESNVFGNRYSVFPNKNFSFVYNTTEPEIAYLNPCYLGTGNPVIAKETILDTEDNVGWGTVDVWQMYDMAVAAAPGCVSYITVDGYDPLDDRDVIPPLGVGKHTVKVYFNRQMNTTEHPSISMGVRPPYMQKPISQNGHWETKRIYTAEITIDGKSATDGLNRLRVFGYHQADNDWELPEERLRYNVQVQAAGSMSTGAVAEPGLGKVTLTWETKDEEFADLMGFNLYRYTMLDNDVASDTIVVNESLIEPGVIDEDNVMTQEYVDYDVVPGQTYYYFIKEIGTDFTQNEISNVVAATPLTAMKGDSNGSMEVDVADVMTDVSYIMGESPQPFIFEAADVNEDGNVDIIDIIGTVDLIMNPSSTFAASVESTASYSVKDGYLYVDSPVELGGVQVNVSTTSADASDFRACDALNGLEQLSCWRDDNNWMFLSFSMSGDVIPAGKNSVLYIGDNKVSKLVLSDMYGRNVTALNDDVTSISNLTDVDSTVQRHVYDITGRKVNEKNLTTGVYIVVLTKNGKAIKSYKYFNK